jgi:hypothetical protein
LDLVVVQVVALDLVVEQAVALEQALELLLKLLLQATREAKKCRDIIAEIYLQGYSFRNIVAEI